MTDRTIKKGEHTLNFVNKQEIPVALVTGSARRIGAAVVRSLHKAGYKVAIHCRNSLNEAQLLAEDLNRLQEHRAHVFQKDLVPHHAAQELVSSVIDWAGRLDLLVNNASTFARTDLYSSALDEWQILFDVNVKAPYLLGLAARPFLSKHQGSIINITDIHAEKPLKGYAVYCQTKAALEMQTKVFAREFAPEIRVNAVAPGAIAWPEETNALSEEEKRNIISTTLLKRHGDSQYIAQAVVSLAENTFITGQIIKVDGGRSLR